jgi:hypothetical protein
MKKRAILFYLIALSVHLCAQTEPDLLTTDSTWKKEMFLFPINFAPEIHRK